MRERVLLVDDDDLVFDAIGDGLGARGFQVQKTCSVSNAMKEIEILAPNVILADYQIGNVTVFGLLDSLRAQDIHIPVIVLTGHRTMDLAAQAVTYGADHFVPKPVDLDVLTAVLRRTLENNRNKQKDAVRKLERARYDRDPFLGNCIAIQQLKKAVMRIVKTSTTVLIQGETGTGKGVLARWIHKIGSRSDEAFVDLNCAGLSHELLESELFGYQRGAFTGAAGNKIGLLEAANHGILFMDEIGDMDSLIQSKMLKVVEEKCFHRLGDVLQRKVDVQIIAATHRDLKELVAEKKFRSDLYFRISTVRLRIPALRERPQDIPIITDKLLEQLGSDLRHGFVRISDDARTALQRYSWPGNIRELRNVLERATLLSEDGVIRATGLEFEGPSRNSYSPEIESSGTILTLSELERLHILRTLEVEGGSVIRTAERLGIPRSSLYAKIRLHGLSSRT